MRSTQTRVSQPIPIVLLGLLSLFALLALLSFSPSPGLTAQSIALTNPRVASPSTLAPLHATLLCDTLPLPGFTHARGSATAANGITYTVDSENNRILQTEHGITSPLAGNGVAGSRDGPLNVAQFNHPQDVSVGPNDTIYVADWGNHRIRKIVQGNVITLAGSTPGFSDGTLASARFNFPTRVSWDDSTHTLLVADMGNHTIRKIEKDRVSSLPGKISCVTKT